MAGLKTRRPDRLARSIKRVREKYDYHNEFKFGRVGAHNLSAVLMLIDVLAASEAHLVATVVNETFNPFRGHTQHEAQADVISQLVYGTLMRTEVAVVLIDDISTPRDFIIGERIKRSVNALSRCTSVVTAVTLDSKSNDLLQAADLVAGSVRLQRISGTPGAATKREKIRVAGTIAAAFGVEDFRTDVRTDRVNVKTLQSPRRLRVVKNVAS